MPIDVVCALNVLITIVFIFFCNCLNLGKGMEANKYQKQIRNILMNDFLVFGCFLRDEVVLKIENFMSILSILIVEWG